VRVLCTLLVMLVRLFTLFTQSRRAIDFRSGGSTPPCLSEQIPQPISELSILICTNRCPFRALVRA
jgi:hypothetical protein